MYTKPVNLYLQSINELSSTKLDVYGMFMNSHHVVRQSDLFWEGVSADLAIEQELITSLTKTGGLTCGCGMNKLQDTQ